MAGQWDDLSRRLASAAGMAVIGLGAVWLGGVWFGALIAVVSGLMVWELTRMVSPEKSMQSTVLAVLGAFGVFATRYLDALPTLGLLIAIAALAVGLMRKEPVIVAVFTLAILGAGAGLGWFRDTYGMVWIVWLILVVITTDVLGYFAGRIFGGPKFWPAISPKKTWSGTVAGWIGAAAIGLLFRQFTNAGVDLPWISMALSLSSQLGDIAESAVKRRMGVKDSSDLIPGHGGLFDRFDGLLAGALFMLLVSQLVYVPEVRF